MTSGWVSGCFTARQRARASRPCVPSAPPSVGPRELRKDEDAVRALTFVVPPSLQGGCGLLSQSCLVKKSGADQREEGGEEEEEGTRFEEQRAARLFCVIQGECD